LAHIRFGKRVYSPIIKNGLADLIISTELLEGLRAIPFAGRATKILVNNNLIPLLGALSEKEILEKLPQKNIYLPEASKICKEKLNNEIVNTLYLLGYAVKNNLIPLKENHVLLAIKKIVPEKYQDLNIKAFNLAF
jgi:indolepyruvate ferredoxin oxidoreductase beta subunit